MSSPEPNTFYRREWLKETGLGYVETSARWVGKRLDAGVLVRPNHDAGASVGIRIEDFSDDRQTDASLHAIDVLIDTLTGLRDYVREESMAEMDRQATAAAYEAELAAAEKEETAQGAAEK
jgi:hypothetical protein